MGLNYTAVDQSSAVTKRRISRGICFVAVELKEILGTILVEPPNLNNTCPHFARPCVATAHQFGVAPARQGAGVGSRLLVHAESWATENGCSELALDTAEPAHHLVALYVRRGYKRIGFVQWDGKRYRSVVMSKRLNNAA
jgi:GNAT superfamily N-acetyltransferase